MSFKLDKIHMIEASCLSFSVNNNGVNEINAFSFKYHAQTKVDTEKKLIFIQLKIEISAEVAESKTVFGNFDLGFTYKVENLEELNLIVEGQQSLDKILHMSLLGISFSTARGIILTKSANTLLNNAYLPMVNPANLLDTKLTD
jgi:hypothetical protein